MSEEFVELLKKQQHSYEQIKTIHTNYKKDSAVRKTVPYLNIRLDALQSHWDEFRTNNDILKKFESTNVDHEYYKKDVFKITSALYEETFQTMTQLRDRLLNESKTPENNGMQSPEPRAGTSKQMQFDTSYLHLNVPEDADEQMATLFRTQTCNFNALERAITKINIDDLKGEWQLQEQLRILRSKWDCIDKTHWQLNYVLQDDDKEYEKTFSYWEKVYDRLKDDINRKMFDTAHYEKTNPRIEVPYFDGDYTNWESFRDLFLETIHDNPTLNNAQKMKFLKSKLRGEAEKLIKHLPVSSANYEPCLQIIQQRYDDKRILFKSYMDTLLSQPAIDNPNLTNLKRIHDTTRECLNGLKNLGLDIHALGPVIVYLLQAKLDDVTDKDYLLSVKQSTELPDLEEFLNYLEERFKALTGSRFKKLGQKQPYPKNLQSKNYSNFSNYKSTNNNIAEKRTNTYHATLRICPLCNNEHALWKCTAFLNMDVATRNKTVNNMNICKNCLFRHTDKCNSRQRCRTCNYKHHTVLHDDNIKKGSQSRSITNSEMSSNHLSGEHEILLTTLQLKVKNKEGDYVTLRALLDQGSQVSLITENAAQRLNLPRNKLNASVTGVGTITGTSKGMIKLECKSIHSDYTFQTEALVMRKLINNLPNQSFDTINWTLLENIELADPSFNISGPIDLLLGADIYSEVIVEGVRKHSNRSLLAQQTKLGWILCGATKKQYNCFVTLTELDNLSQFWEMEDIPSEPGKTESDEYCEQYYTQTTERLQNGRYVVKMPMKPNYEQNLGNSKSQAIAQFRQLEKKMTKQEHFATLYKQFIH